jgi:hypothetical protein
MTPAQLGSLWLDPPAIYRGAPFWSWNSELDPARLCRQIEAMHRGGMGGFFMHSRYGLKTPYLSEEWFACVSACVEKARELGLKAYLYDEDRWPSGPAGGFVTRAHPEFRAHYLLARDPREPVPAAGLGHPSSGPSAGAERPEDHRVAALGLFRIERDLGGELASFAPASPESPGELIVFEVYTETPTGWTNDGGYLDTLNPDAMTEYLRVTHEEYGKRYGADFGGVIPALFTDEPNDGFWNAGASAGQVRVPWTRNMLDEFRTRRGYDLVEHLPELVLSGEAFSKARYDYHRTMSELFVEHFSRRLGDWCGEHGIALTGHYLLEGALDVQVTAAGACMPHYEHMQWPGIDILTDQTHELLTAKQCSSVADQLGRERVLSELYGCTGWDWPLEGHKFQGDWQFVAGVNFRCQHLTHYSLAGGAKRDYPASICDHSPWWPHYRVVEDYFARLSLMLTRGRPVRDVLIVHPIESAWGLVRGVGRPQPARLGEIQAALTQIMYTLMGQHYDWDFGDESLLARHAEVLGDRLRVGRLDYSLVIVPPCVTLRASTVELLWKLVEAGGRVVFVGDPPDRVGGVDRDGAGAPSYCDGASVVGRSASFGMLEGLIGSAESCEPDPEDLMAAVEDLLPRRLEVTERGLPQQCVWAMLREIDGGQLLFLQSHDRSSEHLLEVSLPGEGPVVLWDLLTGARTTVEAETDAEFVGFTVDVPPSGSALLTLGLTVPEAVAPPEELDVADDEELKGPYAIELTEPNTLPLDYCRLKVDDEPFSDPIPTLKADELIRARYGLGTRLGNEHQPWYLYATGVIDTTPRGRCVLRWEFHVSQVPARCALAIENPDDYAICVNGHAVSEVSGHWVDEDIRTLDIAEHLGAGANEVTLTFDYRPDMELEDLYLVGDFGVAPLDAEQPLAPGNVSLIAPVAELEWGSWVEQGLPFYSAAVRYKLTVEAPDAGRRLRLLLPGIACTAAAVHANGQTFVLPWGPFQADLTEALQPGENEVVVEVIGGRKNILGPLHTPWGPGTGPHSFSPDHPEWTFEYHLTDHGLLEPPIVELLE